MGTTTSTRDSITLTCTPEKQGDTIVFAYTVKNDGRAPAYVSDAETRLDMKARTAEADPNGVTIWRGGEGYAHVLKGVAPWPTDRTTLGRVMPLMVRLAPGAVIARKLVLPMPLAEHSPYYGIGNLRDYSMTEIEGVRLLVDVLPEPDPAFVAEAVPYAKGMFDVGVRGTLPLMRRLACDFRAHGLHLMIRNASYPRPD